MGVLLRPQCPHMDTVVPWRDYCRAVILLVEIIDVQVGVRIGCHLLFAYRATQLVMSHRLV